MVHNKRLNGLKFLGKALWERVALVGLSQFRPLPTYLNLVFALIRSDDQVVTDAGVRVVEGHFDRKRIRVLEGTTGAHQEGARERPAHQLDCPLSLQVAVVPDFLIHWVVFAQCSFLGSFQGDIAIIGQALRQLVAGTGFRAQRTFA